MAEKKPFKSPYRAAYLHYRRKGLPAIKAFEHAKQAAALVEKVMLQKRRGLTSEQALEVINVQKRARKIIEIIRQTRPELKIGVAEASELDFAYDGYIGKKHSNYALEDFLGDYAQERLSHPAQKRVPSSKTFVKCVAAALKKRFGAVHQKIKPYLRQLSSSSHLNNPLPHKSTGTEELFSRLEREDVLRKSESQRMVLQDWFYNQLEETNLTKWLRSTVSSLKMKVHPTEVKEVKMRVAGFEQKPQFIRERIVQEFRARKFGDDLSDRLLEKIRESQDVLSLLVASDHPEARHNQFVLECLARPANKQFLAQKAIELFSRKQAK